MGQLTSSIAHEVAQPIGAIAINAGAALRWLGRKTPDIEEARISIERIAEDAHRSGEVIGRIRELFQKAPPRKGHLDLNEVVREVIVLTHSEALKTGVSVKTQLADGLSLIEGDRVQLQQVVLNLVVNAIQAMATVADGVRDLLITTARTEANFVLVRVAELRARPRSTDARACFRSILHYQARRFGHGPGNLPFNHRCPQRTLVGERQPAPRGRLSVHVAG